MRGRPSRHPAGTSAGDRRNRSSGCGRVTALVSLRAHPRRSAHAHDLQRRRATHSTRWSRHAAGSATSTSRSPTIRSAPRASRTLIARRFSRANATRSTPSANGIPQITILHGVEADIMPDGSLDFPDRVLESLDIVLASLHDSARHDGKTLTRRCIQAIRHPLVTIVTHPANQLVGRRAGYPLDFDAIYAAAAETGTALEVDGAPSHLDLDGERARERSPPE